MKRPGYIVETSNGKIGRTFHNANFIKGKCPVYLQESKDKYSSNAILHDPKSLKVIGYID